MLVLHVHVHVNVQITSTLLILYNVHVHVQYGFTKIVSSPFRRCLQSAAVAARALGVPTVDVHKGVGEGMAQVKRNGWTDGPDHQLIYLSDEEMWVALVGSAASLDTASQVWR